MSFYKVWQVGDLLDDVVASIVIYTGDRNRTLRSRATKKLLQFDTSAAVSATGFSWKEIVASVGLICRLRDSFCFDRRHFEMNSAALYQPIGQGLACQISAAYSLIVRSLEKRL